MNIFLKRGKRAHFKKGGIFLALKGLHIPAQGNALGNY
jgi:hypothetical protein